MTVVLIVGLIVAGGVFYALWMADQMGVLSLWPRQRTRKADHRPEERAEDLRASGRGGTLG
jgi:hypothetical protein